MKKRKAQEVTSTPGNSTISKKIKKFSDRPSKKDTLHMGSEWPEYFHSAINTVLGFVSSKKNIATTFPVIRSSVEALLKRPLELANIAELKALLPELIKFSYIPQNEIRIHGGSTLRAGKSDCDPSLKIPAFSFGPSLPQMDSRVDNTGHVLILEFADNFRGKKPLKPGLVSPPLLTATAMKKLIDKRNERYCRAVDELILATAVEDDPVNLLKAASHAHIPVNPSEEIPCVTNHNSENMIPSSIDRPPIEAIIAEVRKQIWYGGQIVEHKTFEFKPGQTGTLDPPLSESIKIALKSARGISTLYTHQALSIHAISEGKHTIVSTSTASGKSLIYQIPVLRFLEENLENTAMFIYPTKALAQDQRAAMENLICCHPGLSHLMTATYDGDTPQSLRAGIRASASVIFTNFDMIHTSILPHEDLWRRFLKDLKLLVVDELHYYTGLLGSHVAQIMRRLRRVCAAIGNQCVRFVSCSATISNPTSHMKNIFGIHAAEIETVTEDGAPSGRKDFLIWNPHYIDAMIPALGRHSSVSEATTLMKFLMKRGIRVILFCKIRKVCELAMKTIRADLSNEGRYDILERTMPYRGGYSQEDRRRIERNAFTGQLLGIVATNALELGIDIGVLDAVIMLGFPTTIASFRQQAGRAGRRSRDSLAVFVADPFPVDQHYVNNSRDLFEKNNDDLVIDLESKMLVEAHLQCASYEMPLSIEDHQYFGPLMKDICDVHLIRDKDGWYHPHPKFLPFPSKHVSIRGTQEEKYAVVEVTETSTSLIEEVEISRAMFEIYEGGVFLHQGLAFIVKELSHDSKVAKVTQADVNWITSPRDFTNVDAIQIFRIKEIKHSPHRAYYGNVEIEVKVFGFFKIRNKTILDAVDLDTPSWIRVTTGLWIDIPASVLSLFKAKGINPAEAIHAAQHAFLNRFSLAQDVGTECKAAEKEYKTSQSNRKRPARIIIYDSIGQSGSVTARAFENVYDILSKACDTILSCDCENGCVQCVQSPSCKEGNVVCSKLGALLVLKGILGIYIDAQSVSLQGNETWDTIVEAPTVRNAEEVQVEHDR
ncbi:P-loop containing nucleoside triphosphate hydrolase protein [Collybia nuda]|uniref:P-loop containing nucleoside triphosphate hydrolase protein n=1 Tax=Collybia nuda TaxID=64659 RepID=A0A9P5XSP4_9AGAR|nr:P-loop containing nucleoside triphosphate hydrolase protein [Collybia nuda]